MLPSMRKQPKQSRSKFMVESITQGCLKILTEEGEAALNTNRLAEVTGVSVGSIYQYFENSESVICALYCDLMKDFCGEFTCSEGGVPTKFSIHNKLDLVISAMLDHHRYCYSLSRFFYTKYHDHFRVENCSHYLHAQNKYWNECIYSLIPEYPHVDLKDLEHWAKNVVPSVSDVIHAILSNDPEFLFSNRLGEMIYINSIERLDRLSMYQSTGNVHALRKHAPNSVNSRISEYTQRRNVL